MLASIFVRLRFFHKCNDELKQMRKCTFFKMKSHFFLLISISRLFCVKRH